MNKIKILSNNVLLLAFCLMDISYSQVKFTSYTGKFRPPIVNMELLFSYSQPLPNMYGNIKDFFSFENYAVKTELIGA